LSLAGLADRITASGARSVHEFEQDDALGRMADAERALDRAWQAGYGAALRQVCPSDVVTLGEACDRFLAAY
jgi:hypothetical protein